MADNRKYYYLKLKENFFDSDSIVLLEDMKDGILYSNILLKLYLKSLKNGGKLQLDEHIPYTAQMIATLTRHQIGTVERALEIFRQLGLVEQLDSGAFYMTDIELMIGQSSTEAERKRAARLENKALLPPRTKGGHLSDIRPPEIEIELSCWLIGNHRTWNQCDASFPLWETGVFACCFLWNCPELCRCRSPPHFGSLVTGPVNRNGGT